MVINLLYVPLSLLSGEATNEDSGLPTHDILTQLKYDWTQMLGQNCELENYTRNSV